MQSKPELYSPEWVEQQQYTQEWSSRCLLATFAHLGIPKSMLDLGCGDGHLCKLAAQLSVSSVGVDIALPYDSGLRWFTKDGGNSWTWATLKRHNLCQPLLLNQQFDLVISWETGEHLPEESAGVYLDSVAKHAAKHVVFTAAAPDQGGEGHVNCQPQEWWREGLRVRGLIYLVEQTEYLRETWGRVRGPCFWYPQNVQVFEKET